MTALEPLRSRRDEVEYGVSACPELGDRISPYNFRGIIVDTVFTDFEAALLVQLHARHIWTPYCPRKQPENLGVTR
jgi:hypothetical protein